MLFLSRQPTRSTRVRAQAAAGLWPRFRFIALLLLATACITLSQLRPQLMTPVRVQVVDSLVPVLDALSRPAAAVDAVRANWNAWLDLRDEVQRLRAENARLKAWEQTGTTLLSENQNLKALLNFHNEPAASSLTARVIATTGAPFVSSLIVTAGTRDGIKKNMAAITDEGLVGRVIEVGEWSSRVLLLTDPDSRIPVMTPDNSLQAIVAGDGGNALSLRYLPNDAKLTGGMRLVTSGHGGLLPAQLPVAASVTTADGKLQWQSAVDVSRLHFVRLVDYSLPGGEANPYSQQLTPHNP